MNLDGPFDLPPFHTVLSFRNVCCNWTLDSSRGRPLGVILLKMTDLSITLSGLDHCEVKAIVFSLFSFLFLCALSILSSHS